LWLHKGMANLLGTGTITVNAGGILTADTGATAPSQCANALVFNGGRLSYQNANMTFSGPVTLAPSTTLVIERYGGGSGYGITLSGAISGSGGLTTGWDDNANVTLSGTQANTYTGLTTISSVSVGTAGVLTLQKSPNVTAIAGDIQIGNPSSGSRGWLQLGAAEQIADTSVVTFRNIAGSYGFFVLEGNNETIAGLNDATGRGIVEASESSDGQNSTLTLAGSGSYSFTGGSGAGIRNSAGHTSILSLVKTGAGTQTLSGTHSYTGATTIQGGVLKVNGSLSGSGTVTASTAGTLAGTGTLSGVVSVGSGCSVSPGDPDSLGGVGTLTVGATTLQSGSTLSVQVTSSTCDKLSSTGTLTVNDGVTLAVTTTGGMTLGATNVIASATAVTAPTTPLTGMGEGTLILSGTATHKIHYTGTEIQLIVVENGIGSVFTIR